MDKICIDEEDNLIEDLEEEEIIVNLKEKKRPTISSNSNLQINEITKRNETNNKSNIIEKEIKSINKKKIMKRIIRIIKIILILSRKSDISSNFRNIINNTALNNSNIINRNLQISTLI